MKRYIKTECGIFECDGVSLIPDLSIRLPEGKLWYFQGKEVKAMSDDPGDLCDWFEVKRDGMVVAVLYVPPSIVVRGMIKESTSLLCEGYVDTPEGKRKAVVLNREGRFELKNGNHS